MEPRIEQQLTELTGFVEDMLSHGLEPGARVMSTEVVGADIVVAKELRIPEGAEVVRISGTSPTALSRIARETSSYYIAGFEPETAERNDARRSVEVRVGRDRAKVHARRNIVIPRNAGPRTAAGKPLTPREMLRVSTGFSDLELRAAAFSSLVGNSTIGGGLLAGTFKIDRGGLQSVPVKVCITAVMVLGGVVAIVFGRVPLQLIITAQAVTILVAPLIGIVMLVLARHRDRGALRIGVPQLVLALVGLAFLFLLAANYVGNLLP